MTFVFLINVLNFSRVNYKSFMRQKFWRKMVFLSDEGRRMSDQQLVKEKFK